MKKIIASLITAGFIVAASATGAVGHTLGAESDCYTVSVTASDYRELPQETEQVEVTPAVEHVPAVYETVIDQPAKDAVYETVIVTPAQDAVPPIEKVSHTEYQWKWWGHAQHGKTVWTDGSYPTTNPNSAGGDWRKNGNTRTVVTQEYVPGKPAVPAVTKQVLVSEATEATYKDVLVSAEVPAQDAVYETVITQEADSTPNSITVSIDGEVVDEQKFGTSFEAVYALGDGYVAHDYVVTFTAWDDPTGENGWTRTITGTSVPCERPEVPSEPQPPVVVPETPVEPTPTPEVVEPTPEPSQPVVVEKDEPVDKTVTSATLAHTGTGEVVALIVVLAILALVIGTIVRLGSSRKRNRV